MTGEELTALIAGKSVRLIIGPFGANSGDWQKELYLCFDDGSELHIGCMVKNGESVLLTDFY